MNAALDRKVGGNFIAGYYAAERQLSLPHPLPPLALPENDFAESRRLIQKWLAQHKPEAILTNSAIVPQALEDLHVRVPEDVALAGTTVYDLPIAAGLNQHPEEIGRVAVELLVSMINSYDRGTPRVPRRVLIDSEWVDGPSLPPRSEAIPPHAVKTASRAKAA
jgi:DNA-binding LacI/PurR family transcriptional regulator